MKTNNKKVAFITGSTRGVGKATAFRFAKDGYIIVLNGTKKTKSSKTVLEEIRKISPLSSIFYFDVSNLKQVENSCQKILKKYQRVDVLVNSAGILKDRTFLKMAWEDWDEVIKVNLYGTFQVTKQILPVMVKQEFGRIINISSIIGKTGNFGQTNYSASKAAVIAFTKSLAKEVARYNINVNVVCPGLVETDMIKNIPKEHLEKLIERIPLKRMATPEEIAELIFFLSSEKSTYITGSVVNINGGWF